MDDRHRGAVGLGGIALGNFLFAAGNWLQSGVSMFVGIELVGAVSMVLLAGLWWYGDAVIDGTITAGRLSIPNVLVGAGLVIALSGIAVLALVLLG